ncbi:uncharacterized protein [Nicotiana sylvestris]|uniref:uncharacterized protein n=1 Tax=Nicotiana sylvestris TaxID=4096 RepID=UPI00388C6033
MELSSKNDKLWVVWIHTYYGKGRTVEYIEAKQASWLVQKILKAKQYMIEVGVNLDEVLEKEHITINYIYKKLKQDHQKMPWRKLVCNNGGMPKWIFILYVAILGKLATRDRLVRWGITNELLCPMCNVEEESMEHLFFKCTYTTTIWEKLLQWMNVKRQPMEWSQEIEWACNNVRGRSANAEIYRIVLASCVYYIWQESNHRIFGAQLRPTGALMKQIIQMVCGRGYMLSRLRRTLEELISTHNEF